MQVSYLNVQIAPSILAASAFALGDSPYLVRFEEYTCRVRYLLYQGIGRLRQRCLSLGVR